MVREWIFFGAKPKEPTVSSIQPDLLGCVQGGMGSRSGILDIGVTHQKWTLKRSVSLRNVQSTRNGGWRDIPIDPVPPVRPNLAVERDQPVQSGNIFGCMWDGIRYGMRRECTIWSIDDQSLLLIIPGRAASRTSVFEIGVWMGFMEFLKPIEIKSPVEMS